MCVLFLLYVFKAEKMSVLRDNVVPLYIYIDSDLIKEKKIFWKRNPMAQITEFQEMPFFSCVIVTTT